MWLWPGPSGRSADTAICWQWMQKAPEPCGRCQEKHGTWSFTPAHGHASPSVTTAGTGFLASPLKSLLEAAWPAPSGCGGGIWRVLLKLSPPIPVASPLKLSCEIRGCGFTFQASGQRHRVQPASWLDARVTSHSWSFSLGVNAPGRWGNCRAVGAGEPHPATEQLPGRL